MPDSASAKSVGLELLSAVAADYEDLPDVQLRTMFRSPGLRVQGKIFAFLGHEDRLIVKLPRERAEQQIAEGAATEVVMGTRRMKEWIGYAADADRAASLRVWKAAAREAYEYVATISDSPR